MLHRRLALLPAREVAPNAVLHEAADFGSRLLGLSRLRPYELPSGHALLVRPCSSIHTFGMLFSIDVAFADAEGHVLRVIRDVPAGRIRRCPKAALALEAHAGELSRFLEGGRGAGARLAGGALVSPPSPPDASA
jgi:uncharacterized membrane protein (UPF0127 family)